MKLIEEIQSRLEICAKATPKPWLAHQLGQIGMKAKDDSLRLECGIVCHGPRDIKIFAPPKTAMSAWANNDTDFIEASRNQREGELAALKVAAEALECETPAICAISACPCDNCEALAQIASLLGPQDKLLSEGK